MPLGFNNTLTISVADTAGIAVDQARVGAGNLTLATSTMPNTGQRVSLTSASDIHLVTFTVYGTDVTGRTVSYAIAGPNANTIVIPFTFATVTRIAASATLAAATVSAGWAAEGDTAPYLVDLFGGPTNIGFLMRFTTSGSTCTVQQTYDDIEAIDYTGTPVLAPTAVFWVNHATAAAKTTNFEGTYLTPIRAIRMYATAAGVTQFIGWQSQAR